MIWNWNYINSCFLILICNTIHTIRNSNKILLKFLLSSSDQILTCQYYSSYLSLTKLLFWVVMDITVVSFSKVFANSKAFKYFENFSMFVYTKLCIDCQLRKILKKLIIFKTLNMWKIKKGKFGQNFLSLNVQQD